MKITSYELEDILRKRISCLLTYCIDKPAMRKENVDEVCLKVEAYKKDIDDAWEELKKLWKENNEYKKSF